MEEDIHPASWWGGNHPGPNRPTILTLIDNNTMDLRTAALLWFLVERKASIVVGAGPRLVGKTTVLTSALDLSPPDYKLVYTKGRDEDLTWLDDAQPDQTYILVPELSDHTPHYLWGPRVLTVFEALDRGFSLGATIHADSPQEVVGLLTADPLRPQPDLVRNLHAVVNLRVLPYGEVERRVDRLTLIVPNEAGLDFVEVCRWDTSQDALTHADTSVVARAFSSRFGIGRHDFEADLTERAQTLDRWIADESFQAADLRRAVVQHYES